MNKTLEYYDKNAAYYYDRTSQVDLCELYERFLRYVPEGGRIMDLGCGSGRDVKWFREHGYDACGLDGAESLVRVAGEKNGIPVEVGTIEDWVADEPFDGIWCCASLVHADDEGLDCFFSNLTNNLKEGGALFVSVKAGIETGIDDKGRYFKNFDEEGLEDLLKKFPGLKRKELWYTEDKLSRDSFKWMNAIILKY